MSETWRHEGLGREEMMAYCVRDRDLLYEKVFEKREDFHDSIPADFLRFTIRSVCRFRVAPRALLKGQLGLCDFTSKLVYYSSKMKESAKHQNTNIEGLVNSTLAHELGHIRLHSDEIEERYLGNSEYQPDERFDQREAEADLYAAIFLVPGRLLVKQSQAQLLRKWHLDGSQPKSARIWKQVCDLARIFKVTPTLMKRCLLEVGWFEECDHTKKGDRKGLRMKPKSEH